VAKSTPAPIRPEPSGLRPSTFQIEHQCPQCGAQASLEETDRLYACPYCRVKSFLLTPDVFRYLLPAKTHSADLIHVPYWRFKGVLLFSLASGNDHKFVDVTRCAAAMPAVPQTLGVRAQAMKLRFVTPESPGAFLRPSVSLAAVVKDVQRRFSRMLDKPLLYQAHLGESVGLLHAPFYASGGQLYDAVLDKPAAPLPVDDPETLKGGKPDWKASFIAALCPDCGWDLEAERDALVLLCRNCASAWTPSGERLTRVDSHVLEDPDPEALYLPFWLIRCDMEGIDLRSGSDLARIANLPSVPAVQDFVFWAPAFRVRPQVYLRLADGFTIGQHQGRLAAGLPPARHHPAALPVEEACESLKIVLAGFYKPRRSLPDVLSRLTIRATHYRLAYIPFRADVHDYIDPLTGLAVGRNTLALSHNL